jgi:uncharacterized tellurite resistance protein B-like protein
VTKLAKVAIGCGIVLVLGGVATIALVAGGAWWLKGKAEQVVGNESKIREMKERAEAAGPAFTPPADGTIQEARLVKFLEIRKRVYAVYEKHKDEIEAAGRKEKADFSDVMKGVSWLNDIRTAQAEAQAAVGMGDAEYAYLVGAIYKTWWASEIARQTGGKSASEAAEQSYEQMSEAMRQAQEQMKDLPPEQREAFEKAMREAEQSQADSREQLKALDVPKANLELFKRHEAEIRQYAMGGLEFLGL